MTFSKELNFLSETLGYIRIHYSLKRVEDDQRTSLIIFGSSLLTTLMVMLIVLNWIISKSILEPIWYLRDATQFIVQGNLEKEIVMLRNDELGSLAESFQKMRDAVKSQITKLSDEVEVRKRAEYNLQITLDSIGDGVITTDVNGCITRINPVAERLTGWLAVDAKGKQIRNIFDIVHADTREQIENPVAKVVASGKIELLSERTLLIAKDGREHLIADSGAPIRSKDGETFGVVLVFRDITEEHFLHEQLRQSQKMDAIGQLSGGIAHDFNNMLGGITGAAEMLSYYLPDDPKARKFHTIILDAAKRSSDLIDKLLSFSRNNPKVSTAIDVHEIIIATSVLLENSIDRRITLKMELAAEKCTIIGDSSQLQNALLNLAINASHAMPEGGMLTIASRNLPLDKPYCDASLFDIQPGEYLEIEVRDTGYGIAPEHVNRIFEPFFSTKEQGEGTGLGLAAVYGTVQQHSGAVTVYSEQGNGTIFHVLLPVTSHAEAIRSAAVPMRHGSDEF